MSVRLRRLTYWLPAVAWMVAIFLVSGDQDSASRSSRIIGPVVRWVFPDLPQEQVDQVVFIARKGAHVAEYAILAVLFWFALRWSQQKATRTWSWRNAGLALLLVFLYAASDELHQAWVPNRYGVWTDVVIDTSGGAVGLVGLWAIGRVMRKW